MKIERPPTDYLFLWFEARGNPLANGNAGLAPFLDALDAHAGEWRPEKVRGTRSRKYSRDGVFKALQENVPRLDHPFAALYRASPFVEMMVSIYNEPWRHQFWVTAQIWPLSLMEQRVRAQEWSRRFIELFRAWCSHYRVTHAFVHAGADVSLSRFSEDVPNRKELELGPECAPREWMTAMFWLNVLSKEWVDGLGRERVLSTPAHLVEELPSGAVLIVTRPTLADWASEEGRQAQARALVHLRPDLDLEAVLRNLRERSATLAPVEPRFDPDVAPLLQRVVDHFPAWERQRKIAEMNALPASAVEEWLPANAALPSDVSNLASAVSDYGDVADRLTVFLTPDVPIIYDGSPEALTDIDFRLWLENFPEVFEREKLDRWLVPSLGAYLGEVLVKHLGGRWVPRQNPDEAQVIVGNRAWLPFLRARHCLRSRQSLLESSLTKLYREAERHRGAQRAQGN
ncbi:MAG TPA: hypothetical protein VK447_16130 [Myxococcaceae bacterium]|nr:hypothetical protein [Myxococcaceae bacterium]